MRRKNVRSIDEIADSIHKRGRANVIDDGDDLLEARAQCEPGQWLNWLWDEFEQSVDSAARYMKVAELAGRFRKLRSLRLGKATLYSLATYDEEELPAIIEELAKHATKSRLKPQDARRVINVAIGRRRFGDYPAATLLQLLKLHSRTPCAPWHAEAVAALKEVRPDSDEAASAIVEEIAKKHLAEGAAASDQAEQEAAAILDGPPPELPPSATPSEPQKFGPDTEWEGRDAFRNAVTTLFGLRTKPIKRFVDACPSDELREVADLLLATASASSKFAA